MIKLFNLSLMLLELNVVMNYVFTL
ncbi:hypothetical protein SAMN05216502_11590 [Citrobacter amalonaticus]|nr:hypothetical protein SAMN05216502_11590 [Citrobacter amalonaticus]